MNNKRRLFIILIVAGVVLLSGIATARGAERVLRVGMVNSAPMFDGDPRHNQENLPMQILRYAAEKEKWRLTFSETSLPDALTGLDRGAYDLVAVVPFGKGQALRHTYSRETVISSWAQIYGEEKGTIKSPLDLAGMVLGVHHDDPYNGEMRSLMRNLNIPCKFVEFNSYQEIFQGLEKKWIQAGVVDRFFGVVHDAEFPDLKKTDIILSPMEYRFAFPRVHDESILAALDYHVGVLKKDPHSLYYRSIQAAPFRPDNAIAARQVTQIKWGLLAALVLLSLAVIANMILRWQVKVKTTALTSKNNELRQEIAMKRQAEGALYRQKNYLTALHETSLDIIGRLDLEDLLEKIVMRAGDLVGTKDGFIYLCNEHRHALRMEVAIGAFSGQIGTCIPRGVGLTGKVIASGEPMMMDDYANWPERLSDHAFDSLRAVMAVPLYFEGTIQGVIGLGRFTSAATFSSDEFDVLNRFGNLASIALNNARLYAKIEEELQQRIQAEEARQRLEEQLRQNQKMEAVGRLAGGIAHDFNNILTPILGYAEMTWKEYPSDAPLRERLERILAAGCRGRDLVAQILSFSRRDDGKPIALEVGSQVKEILKLLRASVPAHIEIVQQLTDEPITVMADLTDIHQIVMNLCTNAAHSMRDKGGRLEITLTDTVIDHIAAARHIDLKAAAYACLSVADTGCGMKPEIMERMFEPFFTTGQKSGGTGIGLAIVHGIVGRLGGAIQVYSEEGRGSVFHVYLPRTDTTMLTAGPTEASPSPQGRQEMILVVDDEKSIADMTDEMLSYLGYRVVSTTSSDTALDIFSSQPERFDLIITDHNMPRRTGIELATAIFPIRPDIPVMLSTGYSDVRIEDLAKSAGIAGIIRKPYALDDLAQRVRGMIDASTRTFQTDIPSGHLKH
jgi:signal transduction histidine kinase/ActR/RegA family two-component response regulator/ABC-type amino acid transport substrate-binding protein